MRFHKLSKYLLDAKQYDRCCFWLTYFQFPWDFSPSFQSSSSTRDFKKCLSTLLTSLQPCICGEMYLTARKGYACSRNAFFLLHKYSPKAQREKNRTLMWHLTFPPRACARSTKFPRSSVRMQAHISDGLKESARKLYVPATCVHKYLQWKRTLIYSFLCLL